MLNSISVIRNLKLLISNRPYYTNIWSKPQKRYGIKDRGNSVGSLVPQYFEQPQMCYKIVMKAFIATPTERTEL